MTNEVLARILGTARRMVELDMGGEFDEAIVQLADERDAAIKQRDLALALLRDRWRLDWSCFALWKDKAAKDCSDKETCRAHQHRALLAEVGT